MMLTSCIAGRTITQDASRQKQYPQRFLPASISRQRPGAKPEDTGSTTGKPQDRLDTSSSHLN
jgi:hypothetical protein